MGSESTKLHTRILRYELGADDARVYWKRHHAGLSANEAFEHYWFGAKSMPRVENILSNMEARFGAYPNALAVLERWTTMSPRTRAMICHWHTQLADPFYRSFTADFLVERRELGYLAVTREQVSEWVSGVFPQWAAATTRTATSKLLTTAFKAGLIESGRSPRTLTYPLVEDLALEYILYLLRETTFEGSILRNPYLVSVGLVESDLTYRLRKLHGIDFKQQGSIVEFGWRYDDLTEWGRATIHQDESPAEAS